MRSEKSNIGGLGFGRGKWGVAEAGKEGVRKSRVWQVRLTVRIVCIYLFFFKVRHTREKKGEVQELRASSAILALMRVLLIGAGCGLQQVP
jgi:hypothetical protein